MTIKTNSDDRFDTPDGTEIYSVSQITALIRDTLQQSIGSVWLVGEISDLARPQSGHVYLTLKDEQSQIRAVMWRGTAERVDFPLDDGADVICFGQIDVYGPRGSYQFVIRKIERRGEGAAQRALRELRQRLSAEGLFDAKHKKPLPRFPRRLAILTSPSGAAITDFLQIAARRWRGSELLIVPSSVQGARAVDEMLDGLRLAHRLRPLPDVLVIARGGGSIEDLQCFNDERLVRAIFASTIPVVSAIGHEIDVTLADLVADRRALTPSEAAELTLPSSQDLTAWLQQVTRRMQGALRGKLDWARQRLQAVRDRRVMRAPYDRLHEASRCTDELHLRASRAIKQRLESAHQLHSTLAARLDALSPLAVLGRGYSVTWRIADGEAVSDSKQVRVGDRIRTRLHRGQVVSRVEFSSDETLPDGAT